MNSTACHSRSWPQHGSGSDGSRTDDHPGQDDAGADPFQHLQKSQFGNGFRVEAQMFNVHDLISLWQAPGFFPSRIFRVFGSCFLQSFVLLLLLYSISLGFSSIFSDTSATYCTDKYIVQQGFMRLDKFILTKLFHYDIY